MLNHISNPTFRSKLKIPPLDNSSSLRFKVHLVIPVKRQQIFLTRQIQTFYEPLAVGEAILTAVSQDYEEHIWSYRPGKITDVKSDAGYEDVIKSFS